jgi:predicted DNA-binding transcriptional regulator YafY
VVRAVRIPGETLPWLRSLFPREVSVAHRLDDGRIEVEVSAALAEMIAQQVAGWGRDLEVMEPPEVRAQLARIGTELVAQHGQRGD